MNEGKMAAQRAWSGGMSAMARSLHLAGIALALAAPASAQDTGDRIEELIVNATRLPRTIENIAGTVSLITAEQIEHEMTEDLDDLVRFQPGVSISTASRGGNEGFSIRGIGGNRVLTIVDGIRSNDIFEAGPATYGRDSIDTDNIKTVELIRGPASVLYGADAIGGAVILTSR
ncbi:MAG: TonB-dependent receptor plug domain-containing protein [Gammaproteobacteria bacterium]|nr:TonB-dependent receptor plug domain-containing protein [Gammaproteobacteria bacterium]